MIPYLVGISQSCVGPVSAIHITDVGLVSEEGWDANQVRGIVAGNVKTPPSPVKLSDAEVTEGGGTDRQPSPYSVGVRHSRDAGRDAYYVSRHYVRRQLPYPRVTI